jgi:thiol:disulfide interchange protein DsbC
MKIIKAFTILAAGAMLGALAMTAVGDEQQDVARILAAFPELSDDAIGPSPMPGIYEITLGNRMAYISADARFLIQGDLYDVETEENLTENRRMVSRVRSLDNVSESSMIVFEPEETLRTITVFTDIDCGYCRKLHREIDSYNEQGIKVRYLFFPRSGPQTASWLKAEEVWCADDRNSALTTAKAGGAVESDDCGATPVADHYQLGRTFGIQGTPAIVADTGELIPGYVSANELAKYLDD